MAFNDHRRVQDLEEVFNQRWQANNDYKGRKEIIDERKAHFNRMYNIKSKEEQRNEILYANSVKGQVENLNSKMRAANGTNIMNKMSNFNNNFK